MKKNDTVKKVVLLILTFLLLIVSIFFPNKNWSILVMAVLALTDLFLILFGFKDDNNSLKVVSMIVLGFAILSWILPAASYSNGYTDQGRMQMGIFELLNYSLNIVLPYFGYIILFIFALGAFYGVLNKIPAYRNLLDSIVSKLKGFEPIFLVIIMILFATLTSIFGIQMGLLIFFPMIASIILMMGYDKIVVALVLVGSTMIGIVGTTCGYSNIGFLNSLLNLKMSSDIVVKIIILLAGMVLLIFNTLCYANKSISDEKEKPLDNDEKDIDGNVLESKVENVVETKKTSNKVSSSKKGAEKSSVKKNETKSTSSTKKATSTKKTASTKKDDSAKETKKSETSAKTSEKKTTKKSTSTSNKKGSKASSKDNKAAIKDDDVIMIKEGTIPAMSEKKQHIWPLILIMVILFVLVFIALIPWKGLFGISTFSDFTKEVFNFEIFKFPIFGKLLGGVNAFGDWTVAELSLVLIVAALLLALVYRVKMVDVYDGAIKGLKKALVPAIITFAIYLSLVIVIYHPFQLPIYKALLTSSKNFNVVTTSIVALLASFFNGDIVYAVQTVIPYTMSVITNTEVFHIIGLVFISMYGVMMLVAPTSLILMLTLSYLGVSFKDWIKSVWKLVLELLILLLIIFTIVILI